MKLEPIDTSTTAGKARVMQLAAEGRKVAYLGRSPAYRDGIWNTAGTPTWDWNRFDFAILAEPVGPDEVWVTVIDGDVVMDVYSTKVDADAALNRGWEAVRYRRVEE